MKIRNFLTAIAVTAVSVTALAQLSSQYSEWGKGPVTYLMTREEVAKWKLTRNDADAKAYVDLFWARRDPTPDTARNEFKDQFEMRVATADKNFTGEAVKGSMTERGKAYILYGAPKKMERVAAKTEGIEVNADMPARTGNELLWTYEGTPDVPVTFGMPRAQIRFVDRFGNGIYKAERGNFEIGKVNNALVQAAIKQPNLTVAPTFTAAQMQAAPAPVEAAPEAPAPVVTELTTPALATAIADFKAAAKNPYEGKLFSTTGEFVTTEGVTFVPVMVFVPKSAAVPAEGVTFFGVVQDESGKNVVAFEEPAKIAPSKDDQYVDKTLAALPAGKYRGYFGLAQDGKALAITSSEMTLAGSLDKDATAASGLILSNNLYPLTEAQKADDPFAFGGIKVVPKADRVFRTSDELWYFFELRHPGVPAPAADAPVTVTGEATPLLPKIQVKVDIEGVADADKKKIKMTAPPREIEAIPMKGVEGHYGVGNAIPLASFKPGEYTFTIKVIDTVKKSSYTMSDKFRVIQ
ncbi:MAG TPA: GWxTD domain-containing protein [Thermoanaerobaculia bacterium]